MSRRCALHMYFVFHSCEKNLNVPSPQRLINRRTSLGSGWSIDFNATPHNVLLSQPPAQTHRCWEKVRKKALCRRGLHLSLMHPAPANVQYTTRNHHRRHPHVSIACIDPETKPPWFDLACPLRKPKTSDHKDSFVQIIKSTWARTRTYL